LLKLKNRDLVILLLSGVIIFLCGVSLLNKKNKKEKDLLSKISRDDSLRLSVDIKDSIQRLVIYQIIPQKINGKLYYISHLENYNYTVHVFDKITNEVHVVDLYKYKIKLNADYHTPFITGLRKGEYDENRNLIDNKIRDGKHVEILTDSIPISTFVKMSK
jgi:hypothetical protein